MQLLHGGQHLCWTSEPTQLPYPLCPLLTRAQMGCKRGKAYQSTTAHGFREVIIRSSFAKLSKLCSNRIASQVFYFELSRR